MTVDYLHRLILDGVEKMNGERTLAGFYHVLKGKKSAQSIQDERLFSLQHVFALFPHLSREELQRHFHDLKRLGWVQGDEPSPRITEAGIKILDTFRQEGDRLRYYQGRYLSAIANTFWKRLVLVVQSLSHLLHHHSQFIPVVQDDDVFRFVKRFLPKRREDRLRVAEQIYHELESLLSQLRDVEACFFVRRLSGYRRVGYTVEQIADDFHLDRYEALAMFQNTLHYLVQHIQPHHVLYGLLDRSSSPVTKSTSKTLHLYRRGLSIDEIATYRQLKRSTIEDHLVELAMHDLTFSIDPFVPKETQQEIVEEINRLKTRKLKAIKESVSEHVTYFQIRLVLVRNEG